MIVFWSLCVLPWKCWCMSLFPVSTGLSSWFSCEMKTAWGKKAITSGGPQRTNVQLTFLLCAAMHSQTASTCLNKCSMHDFMRGLLRCPVEVCIYMSVRLFIFHIKGPSVMGLCAEQLSRTKVSMFQLTYYILRWTWTSHLFGSWNSTNGNRNTSVQDLGHKTHIETLFLWAF